jgi:hypothetical protein
VQPSDPTTRRPRWRRRLVKGFVAGVLAVQVGFAINGYRDPHRFFAFQPFNESSTWSADIVRVTWDGERLPIEDGWAGYRWSSLVDLPADRETRFLEATVTYHRNTRGPQVTVLRSVERDRS